MKLTGLRERLTRNRRKNFQLCSEARFCTLSAAPDGCKIRISSIYATTRLILFKGCRSPRFVFFSALTAHGTFVRVNFGVISVRARRRPRCGKEDLHALRRDVIRSRQCTGCIVPLRGVRMEGSGPSLGNSRGRSRSDLGSSRVRGPRRGRFHRDVFSPSRLFFPCSVSPCVGRTHFFVCPIA